MKFSIIVPVYNVEEYLDECIQSILSQSCTDFEILLINDGSTDQSGAICDRYAQMYSDKVVVIHNKNQGQMRARNCGVQYASGDVCLFIDSDDYVRQDYLARISDRFQAADCDLLLFNGSSHKNFSSPLFTFPFHDGQVFEGDDKRFIYELAVTTRNLNVLWIKAVSMELVCQAQREYQGFEGKNGEDLLYSLPIVSNARRISYLDECLYYYRQREGSTVRNYNPTLSKSIKYVHQVMETYIDQWGMQHLHPLHYAREVRGWIVCVRNLLKHEQGGQASAMLRELAEDDYFRHAYAHMDAGVLSRQDTILSRWLYRKNYGCLMLAGWAMRLADKVRGLLKKSS